MTDQWIIDDIKALRAKPDKSEQDVHYLRLLISYTSLLKEINKIQTKKRANQGPSLIS